MIMVSGKSIKKVSSSRVADCKLILILRQLDRFREDDSSAGNFRATEIADIVSEDFFGSLCDWMFDEGIG